MRLNEVNARTGLSWVKAGVRTFWRQPLAMSGLFFMFMAVLSISSLLPVLGSFLALALRTEGFGLAESFTTPTGVAVGSPYVSGSKSDFEGDSSGGGARDGRDG